MKQFTFSAVMANNLLTVLQGCSKTIRLLLVMFLTLTVSAEVWGADVTLSSSTITSGKKLAYTSEWTYTANNVSWSGYCYTDANSRPWIQLKKDKGVYVKIVTPSGSKITQLKVTITSSSNSSGGVTDITKHTDFSGRVALLTEDATGSTSMTGVAYTTTVSNDIATLNPSGNNNTLYLKVSAAARIWSMTVTYETAAAATYKVTYNANGATSGTAPTDATSYTSGTTVTVKSNSGNLAKTGYTFGGWNTKSDGTGTNYTAGSGTFTITTNTTLYAKWNTATKYTVTLNAGPGTCAASVTEASAGAGVTLPTPTLSSACQSEGWSFAGWAEASVGTETTEEPTLIPTGNYKPSNNITLYAVYQRTETTDGTPTVTTTTDKLTRATTDVTNGSTTYSNWSEKKVTSSAVYAGNSAGGNDAIQLRSNNSNSGVITTASGGKAKKVIVEWNSSTADGRTLDIYGKNSTYTAATDLYSTSTRGTKLGSIAKGSTTLTITGDYEYIGLRSNSGAMYLTSISITWESTTGGGSSTTYYHSTPDCGAQQSYSVTYDVNGTTGYAPVDENDYNSGDKVTILNKSDGTNKQDYFFAGWATNPEGTGDVYQPGDEYTITDNTIFYAKWVACSETNTPNVTITNNNTSEVTISWNPIDGANEYRVYLLGMETETEIQEVISNTSKTITWGNDVPADTYMLEVTPYNDNQQLGCGGEAEIVLKAPTYTITWMVNDVELISGGDNIFNTERDSGEKIYDLPNEPDAPTGCYTKVFVGWTTVEINGETNTKPTLYKKTGDFPAVTENVTYYAVWADEQGGGSEGWVLTDIANVEPTKDVLVTVKTSGGTIYALNSQNGTSAAPPATVVDSFDKEPDGFASVLLWHIEKDGDNFIFYPKASNTKWLYCTNDNNGVRVGTNSNKTFTIDATSGYLKHTSTNRYVGVYTTNPDWRCYDDTDGNIANQTLGFYTYQSSTTYSAYTTICDNTKATITYNLDGGTGATCEKTTVTKGEEFTLCSQTPTKEGYHFAGWSDGTKTYAAGDNVTVDDHTTFYASWNPKSITITWDQNYTDCPEAATSTYIYDGEEIAMPADPTRVGYKFTGWFTASTDGTQVTEVGETNKPTADVIYYAHWAELYTVTFMASGQVYAKQEFKYLSGATLQLPADPSAANYACDGYIFDGWSETEKTDEDATKPELITNPTITKDEIYYAVWKKASSVGAGETIFYESFNDTEGTGGNDGKWSGSIATSTAYVDNDGWVGDNFSGADQCMKLGSGSKQGYITTPTLSQLSGNATLSFKAAAWNGSDEKTTLRLSIAGGGSLSQTSVTLKKGAWQTYELTITGGTSNTQITFAGYQASDSRFFLDEVKVATSGSYNYTTSPSCGPTIVAKEGMWVTSTNAQSVKVNVPIAVKSFTNNATITGTTANENFVVTPLENVDNGEHNVVVTYTPNAYNTKEDATITLTAKVGEETISTTTFTLNGRSLPEAFAVVVDKASTYFALPSNMPEAGVYPGFNVSLNADKSAVVAAPKTHLYALKSVHKDRLDVNGTCVRLEGNNTACLWATNAASGTHIRNWAQLNNANSEQYEWSLYTEDGDTYSISCAAVTEEGRILRMYGDNFGMYKSGASVFRLLPVECTEQPTNVLVSAARVAATIAWTNAATCDVEVYLKSNASWVKTLSDVASPVTVTGLTETTEYTYTITPVGNVACEVSGEFKTTGPDIDIVEWMTDGVIIQVDKDEALNPKVVIKGEVEHNTGSGVMATELFFSKYFEAHGHNKLLAIYNGTGAPIDLSGYEIKSENGTLDLSQFGQTKGTVAPNEEIILVYYDATDNNNDNIPDYSAEPCAEEQEGYEKWNILTVQSVLAFSGRGSIGLYKDDELIDVIGSTFPSGELTKIGKSGNPDYCGEEEDIRLYIDGLSVNDQSSFFCTNGDNIKTDEVEENYAISTNRCLLIRKNTVTSGEDAVTTNKAKAGATCGELSSTFKTLCSEWAGFRIGSGKSTSDEIKDATCDGLGYVGGFDYNKYYREFQTLDDSKTLDKFEYNLEENLYKLTIDNVAQYSCLNIQVQINDPVNGTVLTEETAQVPILVTAANTTTDELFSNIIDDDLDASRTRCSTCDVVVLDGATLTKAAAETANDVNQVRNLYVYPGGQLIVPETGNDYKVNSISFRRVEDAVANAQLSSNLNITASSEKPIYADVRVNAENWHWFTLPYDCNIADVTWVDGTPAKYGVDWFLSTYDGEKRAATQSGGCWAEFHGETIKAGVGYIVGIAGHPTKSKVKYELRFPMSKEVLAQEVEGTDKTVPVYAWGVDEDMRPTHKGWNLVGNPYLDYYQKNKLNSFGGLRLGGKYVLNQSTGYWEDSGKWDGVTGNLPYVVVPIDGGWSAYDQVLVSSIDLLPFTAYFVQVGNPETEDNEDLKDVMFDGDNRGRASIARRAPSSVSEQEEPVIVGVSLSNSKGESDMTSLVIDDKYTDEYEMNADFFKWFGDYYRYYTRPVVYTIGADKQQRAFNALNEEQAAKPVSMGTYTAQNGEYTFSLDRRSDLTRVKEVWLHDATESAYINLMQEDYSFSAGKTDGIGRFTLAVTLHPKSATDITDGMNGQVYVTSQQRMLYVNNLPQQARVWVYDAVGKLLVNESTNVYQRAYHVGQAGVYFVRVESQNGCETLQAVVE